MSRKHKCTQEGMQSVSVDGQHHPAPSIARPVYRDIENMTTGIRTYRRWQASPPSSRTRAGTKSHGTFRYIDALHVTISAPGASVPTYSTALPPPFLSPPLPPLKNTFNLIHHSHYSYHPSSPTPSSNLLSPSSITPITLYPRSSISIRINARTQQDNGCAVTFRYIDALHFVTYGTFRYIDALHFVTLTRYISLHTPPLHTARNDVTH